MWRRDPEAIHRTQERLHTDIKRFLGLFLTPIIQLSHVQIFVLLFQLGFLRPY